MKRIQDTCLPSAKWSANHCSRRATCNVRCNQDIHALANLAEGSWWRQGCVHIGGIVYTIGLRRLIRGCSCVLHLECFSLLFCFALSCCIMSDESCSVFCIIDLAFHISLIMCWRSVCSLCMPSLSICIFLSLSLYIYIYMLCSVLVCWTLIWS